MGQNIGVSLINVGGNFTSLNVTAAKVIKATPGVLMRIVVTAPGTGGALTINDNAATGGTNVAANQVISVPFGSLSAGQVIPVEAVCVTGITVSAVPTGSPVFTITYN